MAFKKVVPILSVFWLWLSAPFFSQINFMNQSFEFIGRILSRLISIEWLVDILLLLGIPIFSSIFYLYLYIKEKDNDLNLIYLLLASISLLTLMFFGAIASIGMYYTIGN